jgi:carbamoyltransferase
MNIIGISAFYHDSACCLLQDGKIKNAAEEERFSRVKFDPSLPKEAFNYCLKDAGLTIVDIDAIAYYENPVKKLGRQLLSGFDYRRSENWAKMDPARPEQQIRSVLGYEGPVLFYDHHLSHAASAYYYSGFESSAILTIDGVGEFATTTFGKAQGNNIDLFEEVDFPHSIGLLYATITSYLGFRINSDEYKVMGLAPYGKPLYVDKMYKLIKLLGNGQYELDMQYFEFVNHNRMYSDLLPQLFGFPARKKGEEINQFYKDISKSLQVLLEEILLEKARYLYKTSPSENLCMAGGVALNCVANGRILKEGPFKKMFVQPAANDAGCALGAAALAYIELTNSKAAIEPVRHVNLGPEYSNSEILNVLQNSPLNYTQADHSEMLAHTAKLLSEGKVLGWFQGRMEFGPRALGSRSIIADPRQPQMRDKINAIIKKREMFRPFAPAILDERKGEYFDLAHSSPYMLETCQVISKVSLPAITHVDNSARVQTVDAYSNQVFRKLLQEFDRLTGCPILLNTSFNMNEPIVCTPADAIKCFVLSQLDGLVMGDYIILREDNDLDVLSYIIQVTFKATEDSIDHSIYTFI